MKTKQPEITALWFELMSEHDMTRVLAIDKESFTIPWSMQRFASIRYRPETMSIAVHNQDTLIAFVIYEVFEDRLVIKRMAVAKKYRGLGIGRQIISWLIGRTRQNLLIEVIVSAHDIRLLRFFCPRYARGDSSFQACLPILENHFGQNHDGYLLRFDPHSPKRSMKPISLANRIKAFLPRR